MIMIMIMTINMHSGEFYFKLFKYMPCFFVKSSNGIDQQQTTYFICASIYLYRKTPGLHGDCSTVQ